jgi:hypothetical protein
MHASPDAPCVNISTKTPPVLYRWRSEMLYNLATPINYRPVLVHKPIFRSTSDCTPVQWEIDATNEQVSINQSRALDRPNRAEIVLRHWNSKFLLTQ